jgi:predicted nucleotidyltransferase
MDKHTVVARLCEHERELKAAGITRLSVFGSIARGDASLESDVDLLAEFDPAKQFSLLDMVGLENRLADIVGVPVDLTPARNLRERVRDRITAEAVLAF